MLQLVDGSIIALEGAIEDVMVSIDSWEYPIDFLVFQPNTKFNGYPIILWRPLLATIGAYISCRAENMTIKNGKLIKQLYYTPLLNPLLRMIFLCG